MDSKGQAFEVRLSYIDSPERDQPGGHEAKWGLAKLIGGRHVYLKKHGEDHYGRVLGEMFLSHEGGMMNINEYMIELGHAWVYRFYCEDLPVNKKIELFLLEKIAQVRKVGLWKSANPVKPWIWRKKLVA